MRNGTICDERKIHLKYNPLTLRPSRDGSNALGIILVKAFRKGTVVDNGVCYRTTELQNPIQQTIVDVPIGKIGWLGP